MNHHSGTAVCGRHPVDCSSKLAFDECLDNLRTKTGAKASALVTVTEGISERVLPDGRIAFLAQPGTPAAEQLTGVCKGRAIWNPRFRNWLCSAERAEEIRHALGTQPAGERT